MHQYFELVDWQGLKRPSAERRQRDSLKSFDRSVEVWKDWIGLKKQFATPGEELPPVELLPVKRKKQGQDSAKRDVRKEELGRRVLAGGNMWDSLSCLLTLLKSFGKNISKMGPRIDSVARQMHQKKVQAALLGQHSQATGHGRGGPHTQRHVNSNHGGGWIRPRFWHRHRHY